MTSTSRSAASPLAAGLPALFDVSSRSALVIGATGAFGGVAARALAAAGARLTLTGASEGELRALARDLGDQGTATECVPRRLQTERDAEAIVAAAVDAHGAVDLVVVASGMNAVAPIVEQPLDDFDAVMHANLQGAWLICRAAGRRMIEQERGGKVVLLSSTRGRLGHPAGYAAYCASKGAVDGLTRALACEWGPHGITVNAIAPTVFRSNLTAWMYEADGPGAEVREAMLARVPLGRLGEPADFVGALLYFLSPASDFCTGQVLYVDGGYTAG